MTNKVSHMTKDYGIKRIFRRVYIPLSYIFSIMLVSMVMGCAAVPVAKDNVAKGVETGDIGLHNEIPVTAHLADSIAKGLEVSSQGSIGMVIVSGIALVCMLRAVRAVTE